MTQTSLARNADKKHALVYSAKKKQREVDRPNRGCRHIYRAAEARAHHDRAPAADPSFLPSPWMRLPPSRAVPSPNPTQHPVMLSDSSLFQNTAQLAMLHGPYASSWSPIALVCPHTDTRATEEKDARIWFLLQPATEA